MIGNEVVGEQDAEDGCGKALIGGSYATAREALAWDRLIYWQQAFSHV